MSENPIRVIFERISHSIQTQIAQFIPSHINKNPSFSISASKTDTLFQSKNKGPSAGPVTREDLGRATWTFLHTLAAQLPDNPTRQQKKDVKELMAILSRMYPCKECADHFKDVLRTNPVQAGSQSEFAQWLCHVHNVVNRSLDKVVFPCGRVDARWGKLDCERRACDLQGTTLDFSKVKLK